VSYRYKFDKEEEVSNDKMMRIFGLPHMRIENRRKTSIGGESFELWNYDGKKKKI